MNKINIKNRTFSNPKKERKYSKIPGILYGKNISNMMFEVGELELRNTICKNGEHGMLEIDYNGDVHKTVIREIQKDPINHKIIHIDLEEIPKDENTINTEIPITFIGEDLVMRKGGIIQKEKENIKVKCRKDNIPENIEVDLSNIKHGKSFKICDIEISQDIVVEEDPSTVVAAISSQI